MTTNHLTPEELSALVDGALQGRALERAEGHLASCASCREALAALLAQEEALQRVLAHDPGEAYFAGFADRVGNRIRAEGLAGAQQRGAAERPRLGAGWGTPRSLARLGAVASVVVGVGIVFLTTRETNVVPLRDTRAIERATRAAPSLQARDEKSDVGREAPATGAKQKEAVAPPAGAEDDRLLRANAFRDRQKVESAPSAAVPTPQAAARSGRAFEVRRDERGEDVPVNPPAGPAAMFARPPAPAPAPAAPGEPVYVKKQAVAMPMKPGAPTTVDKLREAPAPAAAPGEAKGGSTSANEVTVTEEAAGTRQCGAVHDPAGRPVAGASVMLIETGATTTTDARGRFCVAGPAGDHTLAVLAVGFEPARQSVSMRSGAPEVGVALQPVSVLGGPAARGGYGFISPARGAPDPLAGAPESLQGTVRNARLLSAAADGFRSAAAWEAAAEPWARIAAARPGGAAGAEALYQLANARFHAWEIAPNPARRAAAGRAIDAFLAGGASGARRDQVRSWRERMGR